MSEEKNKNNPKSENSQPEVDKTSSEKTLKAEPSAKADSSKEQSSEKKELKDSKAEKPSVAEKEVKPAQTKGEESSSSKTSPAEASSKSDSTETSETPVSKETSEEPKSKPAPKGVQLEALFAFKMSMTTFYNDNGESVPVTALRYEPSRISQIKTQEKDSYSAVQVAFQAQKNKRCSKARINHLKPAGFKEGARFVREIRQDIPEGLKVGQEVSIESLKKGDLVKISSLSKGRGFAGVMKKWNFAGGRATHGSKSHRRTGSIGQHTEPARVFPGRKMPGHYGCEQVSRLKVPVVDVLPEEGMIFVKGPVPGARNTLVSLQKMS